MRYDAPNAVLREMATQPKAKGTRNQIQERTAIRHRICTVRATRSLREQGIEENLAKRVRLLLTECLDISAIVFIRVMPNNTDSRQEGIHPFVAGTRVGCFTKTDVALKPSERGVGRDSWQDYYAASARRRDHRLVRITVPSNPKTKSSHLDF